MESLTHSDRITVNRSPGDLYAMVADVTRMGEWSPICKACWWDEGEGPRVGAWFTGENELPERTWETRSEVADRVEKAHTGIAETLAAIKRIAEAG